MVHGANRGWIGERKTGRPTNEHDLVFDYDVKVIVAIRHGGVLEQQQLSCSKVSIPKKEKDGDLRRPSDIIFVH